MGGEFAAGITKGNSRIDQAGKFQGTPDLFVLARVKGSAAANADLATIDKLVFPKTITVQGVAMRQLGTLPDASAYYGVGDDWMYVLWGDPGKVLAQRNATSGGLTGTAQFGLVRRALTPGGIVLYADIENGRRALEDLVTPSQRESYDKSRVLLQPIKALGGSFRTEDRGDIHGQLLLAISK
jgi:hypothetical protein